MTERKTKWARWQGLRGRVTYWKGFVAFHVYLALPAHAMPFWTFGWLLPSVGDYAYWDETIEIMNSEGEGKV